MLLTVALLLPAVAACTSDDGTPDSGTRAGLESTLFSAIERFLDEREERR